MNYWYVAKSNEFLIDMDKPHKSAAHFLRRLAGAVECAKYSVKSFEAHPSRSGDHLHFLITLENHFLCEVERVVWEIILHSDIYKGCATLMRLTQGVDAADLLITPFRFNREPDDVCDCKEKHAAAIMKDCPAAIRLRGDNRVRGFFGIPSKKKYTEILNETIISCNSVTGFLSRFGKPPEN